MNHVENVIATKIYDGNSMWHKLSDDEKMTWLMNQVVMQHCVIKSLEAVGIQNRNDSDDRDLSGSSLLGFHRDGF